MAGPNRTKKPLVIFLQNCTPEEKDLYTKEAAGLAGGIGCSPYLASILRGLTEEQRKRAFLVGQRIAVEQSLARKAQELAEAEAAPQEAAGA